MSYKYQGDSILGVSLTVQTPKPLDTRLVVNTRSDLYDIPSQYAYLGMAVACIADGNIYTLIDKNSIKSAAGWKASYESVQIVTCTEAEYKTWQANTNENFTPKDDTQTWLHQDIYYYIYEDSIEDQSQFYVSYKQFSDLKDTVNKCASLTSVTTISNKLSQEITDRETGDTELKALIDAKIDSSNLENYYTKTETDDTFVTKQSLRGDSMEGDDFVFVTQTQYTKDQESLTEYKKETSESLDSKVTTGSDAQLNSLNTSTITNNDTTITIGTDIVVNNKALAYSEDVPKIIVLDQQEYEELEEKDPDVYYMTHGTETDNGGVITSAFLEKNYYTQTQVLELLEKTLAAFCEANSLTNIIVPFKAEKPVDKSFIWDGEVHTLEATAQYDVVGEGGSDVGTYKFKVIPKAGCYWTTGGSVPIFVYYTITAKPSYFNSTFPFEFTDYDITNSYTSYGDEFPIQFT